MDNLKKIIATIIFAVSLINGSFAQDQKPQYEIIIDRDGFSSFNGKDYVFITVYLNNNSNNILYYRGSDCYNRLFNLKRNPYFHLANDNCNDTTYSEFSLPPQRSQRMQVFLKMDKSPDKNISLVLTMNLYKWANNKNSSGKKFMHANRISDSITVHYNAQHQIYYPYNEFETLNRKEERILPNKDIYLLTNEDRKRYILKVDENQISRSRDTTIRMIGNKTKGAKSITVPVVVQNNSDEELKFYSMTCSWQDFFGTDDKDINIPGWGCESNVPNIITVAPHKEFRRDINVIYDPTIKRGGKYRISMSLLKPDKTERDWFFFPGDYVRYNKIWTNEIAIKD